MLLERPSTPWPPFFLVQTLVPHAEAWAAARPVASQAPEDPAPLNSTGMAAAKLFKLRNKIVAAKIIAAIRVRFFISISSAHDARMLGLIPCAQRRRNANTH